MSNKLHDDFMELGNMQDLDNRILADAGEDSLIDRVREKKEKGISLKAPWMNDVREHWFSYALLALSFLLTEMLAIYLGLAPRMETALDGSKSIYWNTDFGHLATAFVYMLVFPIVTEVSFDQARKKFNKRETGNFAQAASMATAIVVSLISIVGTGVAGGYVVLSTLGALGFMEIPRSVQTWLVWVIPTLLAIFSLLHMVYNAASKEEKSRKLVDEEARNDELEDQLRMKKIERAGRRAIRAAAIQAYERAVSMGLLSQTEANSALAQGKSLAQLEMELNRDLTGEGKIGDTSGLSLPVPPVVERPDLHKNDPEWTKTNSRRGSIIPWHCPNCDGWYVSDSCPRDGTVAPELVPVKPGKNGLNFE